MAKNETLDDAVESVGKELPFKETSELGQVFENLDSDVIDINTKMSKIDFNARLKSHEARCCIVVDELISLGILPPETRITTQTKRLSVSLDGQGRKEKVEIASANRGAELSGKSGGMMGLFRSREEK